MEFKFSRWSRCIGEQLGLATRMRHGVLLTRQGWERGEGGKHVLPDIGVRRERGHCVVSRIQIDLDGVAVEHEVQRDDPPLVALPRRNMRLP